MITRLLEMSYKLRKKSQKLKEDAQILRQHAKLTEVSLTDLQYRS